MMNGQQIQSRQPVLNLKSSSQPETTTYSTEGGTQRGPEQYSIQNQNQNLNQNNNNYKTRPTKDSSGGGGCWDDLAYSQPTQIQQQQQPQRSYQQYQQQQQPQSQYSQYQQQRQLQQQQQQRQSQQLGQPQMQQNVKRQQQYGDGFGARATGQNGFMYGQSQRGGSWYPGGQNPKYGIKVYITGLAPTVQWRMLKDFLRQAGNVTFASNWKDGTGVGEFATMEDALASIRLLSGTPLHGSPIKISMERGGGMSSYGSSNNQYSNRSGGSFNIPSNPFYGPQRAIQNSNNIQLSRQGGYTTRGNAPQQQQTNMNGGDMDRRRQTTRYNPY